MKFDKEQQVYWDGEKQEYTGWIRDLGNRPFECMVRKLVNEIHTLLKESGGALSGIPSRFGHIDRNYYDAAVELLEKEGKAKVYGKVVKLIPDLEDRKKALIERIQQAKTELIDSIQTILDDYDRGDTV